MAKQQKTTPLDTNAEVVEDLHATVEAEDGAEFTDVTGKDDLPEGVTDVAEGEDDEPAQPKKQPKVKAPAAAADEEIPAELKGKTPAQLAKMYRDAQQVIGRQGDELGKLREAADTYIRANLQRRAAPVQQQKVEPVKQPDDVDFFTDPKKAMEAVIANHPAIKELSGKAKEFAVAEMTRQRQANQERFNTSHPDAAEVLGDERFRAWVGASPIRKDMLLRAHQHYDLNAANELFNTWKELESLRKPAEPAAGGDEKKQPKPVAGKEAARVPTGGNASPRGSKTAEGKIYRRADVVRLMSEDPDRYASMAEELTKAYAEKRVR